jgi:polyhydroxyalkanoate synthesis regulator phasin
MNEIISKAVFSGLGFASLTGEAIRKTAQDLVKRSKLSEAEGKRLVKDFQRRSVVTERAMKRNVDAAVRKALKQLDLERIPHSSRSTKSTSKRQTTHAGHGHATHAAHKSHSGKSH